MRAPDFFIVGAAKSGTSAMHVYLRRHPEIFMYPEEPHFFAKDYYWSNWPAVKTREEYIKLFRKAGAAKLVGEKSVTYLASTVAANEIKREYPLAKIIIMLRNPVDMLYSYHSQLVWESVEEIVDFEAALEAEKARRQGLGLPKKSFVPPKVLFYTQAVKYSEQVQRYLNVFGREQIRIIIFDDFKNDTERIYRETLEFLGVDPEFEPDFNIINPNKQLRSPRLRKILRYPDERLKTIWKTLVPGFARERVQNLVNEMNTKYAKRPAMPPDLRQRLHSQFAGEVQSLSDLLGVDLRCWRLGSRAT